MDLTLKTGRALLAQKKYQTVHAAAIELIHQNIDNPLPYFLLGQVAFDHQNFAKALDLYSKAATLGPDEAEFNAHHAKALCKLGRHEEARTAADIASSLPIDNAFLADTIGVVYSLTGFHEKAIPLFERAVSLDPTPANFHYNLGASCQFSGDFERAEIAYLNAIHRKPDFYRAYSSLVMLQKQTDAKNYLETLKKLFAETEDDPDAALHFGHAIAKTLEDMNRFEESLEWLKKAKKKKRASLSYTIESDLKNFDAAKGTWPRANAVKEDQSANAPRQENDAPIFVIGLPRTGTTLIDRILSSHPDVVSAGELNTFAGLIKEKTASPSNLVMDEKTLRDSLDIDLSEIGQRYIEKTIDLARGARRMTDKMPLNFFYAGLIHQALPHARIVALRRGAMDSCLSNFRQLFSTGFSYYNYTFDLNDTAQFYQAFDNLMAHWRQAIPDTHFMEVQYEDIIFQQEETTQQLLKFCDLEWDEACLRFHENKAPVSTASSVQVRQPLYTGSIDRWKKYGDKLAPLAAALGGSP